MKIIFGAIGAILLVFLFFVVYQIVLSVQPDQDEKTDFTSQPLSIGQTGGFHWLTDITVTQNDKYDTITFYTKLNRGSVIEDIITPLTEVMPEGSAGIRVKLTDTAVMTELPKADYDRVTHQTPESEIIQDIAVTNPKSSDLQEIIIGLSKSGRYRLSVDPRDAGIIYLDVLK